MKSLFRPRVSLADAILVAIIAYLFNHDYVNVWAAIILALVSGFVSSAIERAMGLKEKK